MEAHFLSVLLYYFGYFSSIRPLLLWNVAVHRLQLNGYLLGTCCVSVPVQMLGTQQWAHNSEHDKHGSQGILRAVV